MHSLNYYVDLQFKPCNPSHAIFKAKYAIKLNDTISPFSIVLPYTPPFGHHALANITL